MGVGGYTLNHRWHSINMDKCIYLHIMLGITLYTFARGEVIGLDLLSLSLSTYVTIIKSWHHNEW